MTRTMRKGQEEEGLSDEDENTEVGAEGRTDIWSAVPQESTVTLASCMPFCVIYCVATRVHTLVRPAHLTLALALALTLPCNPI